MSSWPPRWLTPVPEEAFLTSHGRKASDFIDTFAVITKDSIGGKAGEPMRLRALAERVTDTRLCC
jgi:hypothetical protein